MRNVSSENNKVQFVTSWFFVQNWANLFVLDDVYRVWSCSYTDWDWKCEASYVRRWLKDPFLARRWRSRFPSNAVSLQSLLKWRLVRLSLDCPSRFPRTLESSLSTSTDITSIRLDLQETNRMTNGCPQEVSSFQVWVQCFACVWVRLEIEVKIEGLMSGLEMQMRVTLQPHSLCSQFVQAFFRFDMPDSLSKRLAWEGFSQEYPSVTWERKWLTTKYVIRIFLSSSLFSVYVISMFAVLLPTFCDDMCAFQYYTFSSCVSPSIWTHFWHFISCSEMVGYCSPFA